MLTLKMMSEQDLPDDDPCKDFTLVQVADDEGIEFIRTGESGSYGAYTAKVVVRIVCRDGREMVYPLVGNCYVMNANGKTVASRAAY
jgi:hypothetical protein